MRVTGLVEARNGVTAYRNRLEKEVLAAFRQGAKEITIWERDKNNHPWQNRTGQAERKIKCKAYREGMLVVMDNGHYAIDPRSKFKYGIALELRHDRRFAILQVALRHKWSWTIQLIKNRMSSSA